MDQSSDTKDYFTRVASNRLSAYMVQQDVQERFRDFKGELDEVVEELKVSKEIAAKSKGQRPDTDDDYFSEPETVISIHSIEVAPRFNCLKGVTNDIRDLMKREIDAMQSNLQKVKDKHAQLKSTTNKKMVNVLKKVRL
jgi:predicted transcriptional regulator